jgi:23S rRNA (guanosine2251-2'-O)-methyltransferase
MPYVAGFHSVRESILADRPLTRIQVARGLGGPRIQEIIDLARERQIPVRFDERSLLDHLTEGGHHQGVVALLATRRAADFEEATRGADLLVALDGIEDPHNLGAIVRTANAAGAAAVLIPERRAAPLTETVERTSAGALAHTPVLRVSNLNQALERLKRAGFWIYGLDEHGSELYDRYPFNPPTVFVFGAEGKGLHQLTARKCDALVRIPMLGEITSLNVSVAAGVVLFDYRRRYQTQPPRPSAGGENR